MSRSPSADVASPVFGRFLLLVRDWNTGELLPLGRNVDCQCAMCARRRTLQSSPAGTVERPPLRRAGFTLVEMVVVLLILALLTVAAVQSLSPVADQARYDATSRTLQQLNEAMLGTDGLRQSDGTPLITGFVADVGRVPKVLAPLPGDTDGATQLRELWLVSAGDELESFNFMSRPGPAPYGSVSLPCGWRGPYLRFGVGVTDLRDGWATPFTLTSDGSNRLLTATWTAASPYSDDLAISTTSALVTVTGTVTDNGGVPSSATVAILYPDPSQSTTTLSFKSVSLTSSSAFSFSDVPIGFRAIHSTIGANPSIIKYLYVKPGMSPVTVNYQP